LGEEYGSSSSSLCSFLRHPQSTFLPQCERSGFTPI
jgi:hypothetical protein